MSAALDAVSRASQPSSGEHFVDEGCGGGADDDNFECLLAPLSTTCGVGHVTLNNSLVHPRDAPDYVGPVGGCDSVCPPKPPAIHTLEPH
jgi:hypothetical protein